MMSKEDLLKIINFAKENGISKTQAAKHFGYTRGKLDFANKKYGFVKKRNEISKEEILNIINYSKNNNISYPKACAALGYSEKMNISAYKKKYNIIDKSKGENPLRKYNVNDNFFSEPNILNCYYAGFIAADGCIPSRDRNSLLIELSSKDRQWIEIFKKNLQIESPIRDRIDKGKYPMSGISFTSSKIIRDLKNIFNIIPKKSLTLMPPNIEDKKLKYAFICGYIDGDGSIIHYINEKRNRDTIFLSILGTYKMCSWIKETFKDITNNTGTIHEKTNTKIFKIVFNTKSARDIIKQLYALDVPKLKRKWSDEVYNHCFNFIPKHNHTFKKFYVFDLYGNLLKECESRIEAHNFSGVDMSAITKIAKLNSNKKQSNGYMFSYTNKMQKFDPSETRYWKFIRQKLISEGKIKPEDFA